MATVLITIPIYQVNSNQVIDRTLYPFGRPWAVAGSTLSVEPNTGANLNELQAGRKAGGALIYSRIKSSATGNTVFYSNLTPAQILALANA